MSKTDRSQTELCFCPLRLINLRLRPAMEKASAPLPFRVCAQLSECPANTSLEMNSLQQTRCLWVKRVGMVTGL